MKKLLVPFLGLLFASSAFADAVTFDEVHVTCNLGLEMNLDGSVECREPIFHAMMSNGVDVIRQSGFFNADLGRGARAIQGQGICGLLGYSQFLGMHPTTILQYCDPSPETYGPSVTVDAEGTVLALGKIPYLVVGKILCK